MILLQRGVAFSSTELTQNYFLFRDSGNSMGLWLRVATVFIAFRVQGWIVEASRGFASILFQDLGRVRVRSSASSLEQALAAEVKHEHRQCIVLL